MVAVDRMLQLACFAAVLLVVHGQPNTAGGSASGHVPVPSFKMPSGVPPLPATVPGPAPITQAGAAVAGRPPGIIRVSGLQFVQDNCTEYLPNGWNTYNDLMRAGSNVNGSGPGALTGADNFVTTRYGQAREAGLNLVRLFATQGDNGTNLALEPNPGEFDEQVFRGLDYCIAQAARFGIKVIIALNNYWENSDSVGNYIKWAGLQTKDQYWNNTAAINLTQAHINKILTRKNVFNGKVYTDEPAIFAWNVMNEPRNPQSQTVPGFPAITTAYINTIADYVKSVDPWHLVTTGQEGFWSQGSLWAPFNPWGQGAPEDWSYGTGQDFSKQHASPSIDFAVMHLWPDNWAELYDDSFVDKWIEGHTLAAAALGKPLLLEEFGNIGFGDAANLTAVRDPLFNTVYQAVNASLDADRPLRGALFWEWNTDGQPRGERAIEIRDTVWNIVSATGKATQARNGKPVPGCTPVSPSSAATTTIPKAPAAAAPIASPPLLTPAPKVVTPPAPVPMPPIVAPQPPPPPQLAAAVPLVLVPSPPAPLPAPPTVVVLPAAPVPSPPLPALLLPLPPLAGELVVPGPSLPTPPLLAVPPPPVVMGPGGAAAGGGAGPVLLQGDGPAGATTADAAGTGG